MSEDIGGDMCAGQQEHAAPRCEETLRDVSTRTGFARMTSPAPRDIWVDVVAKDPGAGPTHLPDWLDCVCRVDGWTDASRLYELPGDRHLVVPMVRRTLTPLLGSPGMRTLESSFPRGWAAGGIVASQGVRTEDVSTVLADLAQTDSVRTLLRPGFAAGSAWAQSWSQGWMSGTRKAVARPVTTHVLDLAGGSDEVWTKRFTSDARSGIRNARRKAEKAGLGIEVGCSSRLVDDFYGVYLRWLDQRASKRAMPRAVARWRGRCAEPQARFDTVAAAFGEKCRIWVARLDGTPIAAAFALFHGGVAIGWRAYSDRELAGRLRTHELVQFLAIEHACELGCKYFDMGESGGNAGLAAVKDRFGAEQHTVAEYAMERLPITRLLEGWIGLRGEIERRALALRNGAPPFTR